MSKIWLPRWRIFGCECMKATLPLIEADFVKAGILQELIDWFQGAYHKGTAKSAGTHDEGGVGDTNLWSAKAQAIWKKWGVIPYHRLPPLFDEHCHVAWYGCKHGAPLLKSQVAGAVKSGWNGLAGRSSRYGEFGRVPAHTWQVSLKLHRPTPPPKPPAPKGILSMTKPLYTGTGGATWKGQPLAKGKAQWVKLKNTGSTSFVYGQTALSLATLTVQASGLKPGQVVHLAWQLVYAGKGKADIVRHTRRVALSLTAANPRGQLTWTGGIPKSDKAGYELRLRAVATTNSATAKIDYATAEGAEA